MMYRFLCPRVEQARSRAEKAVQHVLARVEYGFVACRQLRIVGSLFAAEVEGLARINRKHAHLLDDGVLGARGLDAGAGG